MSIATPTEVFASGNVNNLSVYDTQVATLQAGRKYYLQVTGYRTAANNISSVVHDPAGTPLSFTLVSDGTTSARRTAWDTAGHRTEEIWEVVPSSTTASALIRITWAAGQSSCGWRLVEVASGFDPSGTTVQVVTAQGTTTAVALTMATFAATGNMLLLFVGWGTGTANPTATIAPTEGRTELGENNDGERASLGCHYQNPNGGDTTVGATLSATNDWGGIGIEVKATAGPAPMTADPGSYSVSGVAASPLVDHLVSSSPGSYGVTGAAAGAIADRLLSAAIGSYAVTGADAAELVDRILSGDIGIYAITGSDVVFVAPGAETVLDALPGSYAVTGVDAATLVDRMLAGAVGAYALSGADVQELVDHLVSAAPGTYQVTGATAAEVVDRLLAALPGSYDLTGVAALLEQTAYVGPEQPTSYAITGAPATLVYSGAGPIVGLEPQNSRLRWARLQ